MQLVAGIFFLIIAQQNQLLKKIAVILPVLTFYVAAFSQQTRFSLATDASVMRSFRKDQRFWAFGQTIAGHFHFAPKDGLYTWLAYYTNGKFNNNTTASAKTVFTTPLEINYINRASLRIQHFSIGWRHYFKGAADNPDNWNLYGYAGFGLLFGSVENTHSVAIDTSSYHLPVLSGKAKFKRLTYDLGLGYEKPLGGDISLYLEGRVFLPAMGYPSRYLFVNERAPLTVSANLGLRILFDN